MEGARSVPQYLMPIGAAIGLAKSLVGLALRPAAGSVEAASKLLQGLGLMCLGKRGIQGKLLRRVMAPGTPMQNTLRAHGQDGGAERAAAMRAQVVAAWQASLEHIAPALAEDAVVDVIAARRTRVVLLTTRHIAYLYARAQHTHVSDQVRSHCCSCCPGWRLRSTCPGTSHIQPDTLLLPAPHWHLCRGKFSSPRALAHSACPTPGTPRMHPPACAHPRRPGTRW
jgi:hypothetical protein